MLRRKGSMDIKKLFALADRAKDIGAGENYTLPNTVFCLLLDALFRGEEAAKGLVVELETDDPAGECASQAHYDLFVLRLESGDERLCIPAPLLRVPTAMALTKRANVLERNEHCRAHERPAKDWEYRELWDELHGEWDPSPSPIHPLWPLAAVNRHLNKEALVNGGFVVVDCPRLLRRGEDSLPTVEELLLDPPAEVPRVNSLAECDP